MEKSIGFLGGGRVTRILLQSFRNKNLAFRDIVVTELNNDAVAKLKVCYPDFRIAGSSDAAAQDIVFISLHPPVIIDTLDAIKNDFGRDSIIISLAPKITIEKISMKLYPATRIVRMIPNATSFINEGYNPVCFADGFSHNEKNEILDLLSQLGKTFEVPEKKLESYAIMSAMLPTYFWFQWQELSKIGQKIGLTEAECRKSINETMHASLDLMYNSDLKAEDVIDLIPVKPLADNEEQIREIYNNKLTSLYEKIKP
jgi:pyrroline-5-carboxylate reductase